MSTLLSLDPGGVTWSEVDQEELERCQRNMGYARQQLEKIMHKWFRAENDRLEGKQAMNERPHGVELTWPQAYQRSLDNQVERDLRAFALIGLSGFGVLDASKVTGGTFDCRKIVTVGEELEFYAQSGSTRDRS